MDAIRIVGFVFIFFSYFIGSWPVGRSMAKFCFRYRHLAVFLS